MEEVVSDLDTLREEWTPKQKENWEKHGMPVVEALETMEEHDPEMDTDLALEWYLRTYRPKKRGSGMMKRDHVQLGEPEHYFIKMMEKFGNAWGSIQGLVMANLGLSEETQEEVEEAAATIYVARKISRGALGIAELQRQLEEHEKVGELYGL